MARGETQAPFGFFMGDSSNWKTPSKPFLSASLGKVLTSSGTDYRAQEDARQISWRGDGRGLISLQTQRQIDLTALGKAAALDFVMHFRLDEKPTAAVLLAMGCGDNCSAQLDITQMLKAGGTGKWRKLAVPLSCFTQKGLNASAVNAPVLLETNGAMRLSLTRIELVANRATPATSQSCPR
jgi:beta-glucosidase